MLYSASRNEEDFIKKAYEYVRDNIAHSADAGKEEVTCSASEVLIAGHGICFAKSHLLAAILRRKNIPTGFCYQKLILDDETDPVLILHGLVAVYINERRKWIRLDARGNKPGVDAEFSLRQENLAFPIRPELGEEDGTVIFPSPDPSVIRALRENKNTADLWKDLPCKLENGN
jgi:transglutaminase-like putative cysteine protease